MLTMLLRAIAARFTPIIARVGHMMAPTISAEAPLLPTIADHLQSRQRSQLSQFVQNRVASGIKAEPISTSSKAIDAATAAISFVRWVADHHLAYEWKVDDVWYLASEDFAPAHKLALPPRRVFLGALKRVPGVRVVYDRRVYGRDGRPITKTTFYTFPPRTAPSASSIPARVETATRGGKTRLSDTVAGDTTPMSDPMTGEIHETPSASSPFELMATPQLSLSSAPATSGATPGQTQGAVDGPEKLNRPHRIQRTTWARQAP